MYKSYVKHDNSCKVVESVSHPEESKNALELATCNHSKAKLMLKQDAL